MNLRKIFAPTAIAFLLSVGGCFVEETGTPVATAPTPGTQPTEPLVSVPDTPGQPTVEVPKVAQPIANLDRFISDPCALLTRTQAAQLKLDHNIESNLDNTQGPQCVLSNEKRDRLSVVFSKRQHGISGIYQAKHSAPKLYAYFEPVDISGHPGVFADSRDDRPDGLCALSVGLTDKQTVIMVIDIKGDADSCSTLKKAATAAVETMTNT